MIILFSFLPVGIVASTLGDTNNVLNSIEETIHKILSSTTQKLDTIETDYLSLKTQCTDYIENARNTEQDSIDRIDNIHKNKQRLIQDRARLTTQLTQLNEEYKTNQINSKLISEQNGLKIETLSESQTKLSSQISGVQKAIDFVDNSSPFVLGVLQKIYENLLRERDETNLSLNELKMTEAGSSVPSISREIQLIESQVLRIDNELEDLEEEKKGLGRFNVFKDIVGGVGCVDKVKTKEGQVEKIKLQKKLLTKIKNIVLTSLGKKEEETTTIAPAESIPPSIVSESTNDLIEQIEEDQKENDNLLNWILSLEDIEGDFDDLDEDDIFVHVLFLRLDHWEQKDDQTDDELEKKKRLNLLSTISSFLNRQNHQQKSKTTTTAVPSIVLDKIADLIQVRRNDMDDRKSENRVCRQKYDEISDEAESISDKYEKDSAEYDEIKAMFSELSTQQNELNQVISGLKSGIEEQQNIAEPSRETDKIDDELQAISLIKNTLEELNSSGKVSLDLSSLSSLLNAYESNLKESKANVIAISNKFRKEVGSKIGKFQNELSTSEEELQKINLKHARISTRRNILKDAVDEGRARLQVLHKKLTDNACETSQEESEYLTDVSTKIKALEAAAETLKQI